MAFPPSFLDEIRNRLGLAEVIGRRVRLQKRGREFIGLCPFHNEKTPSFNVVEEKGFFHCFGCGAHGDQFGFVMRSDNLSFPEAVERLAGEVGLEMPAYSPQEREAERRRATIGQVLEAACAWFEAELQKPAGRRGLDYLRRRGLDDDTIARFRLGWATPGGALRTALQAKGIEPQQLIEAGLVLPADGDKPAREFFRDRVMFPIADRRGLVIAFGARALGDEKPKYLNSRDHELFHKGRTLYNLARAREAARDGRLVVAEGYMDVIAFHQAGIDGAVAPLGTALTEDQLGLLWKLVPEPIVCLDGDAAGMKAAIRAAERALPLLAAGRSLRFALLPQGEDPDSLLRAHGPDALREALDGALPLAELLWRDAVAQQPADTPERKAGLRQALMGRARAIADPVVREYYQREFMTRFDREVLPAPVARPPGRRGEGLPQRQNLRPSMHLRQHRLSAPTESREWALLAAVVARPALLEHVADDLAGVDFGHARLEALRRSVIDWAEARLSAEAHDLKATQAKDSAGQAAETLDATAIRLHLEQGGFAALVERLGGQGLASVRSLVRSDTPLPKAIEGWRHIMGMLRLPAVKDEVDRAEAEFSRAPSEEAERRLLRLREEYARVNRAATSLSVLD